MDASWQVIIGSGIGVLLLTIFGFYRAYSRESQEHNEKQGMAKASILFGLSGLLLVGVGSLIGIILGFLSMHGKQYKALSKIGILISILTLLPWVLILILGP